MDDGRRIPANRPCPAFDDFPRLCVGMRVKRLGRSAHVALAGELSGALRHHAVVPFRIRPIVVSSASKLARAALPPRDPVMVGRATGVVL